MKGLGIPGPQSSVYDGLGLSVILGCSWVPCRHLQVVVPCLKLWFGHAVWILDSVSFGKADTQGLECTKASVFRAFLMCIADVCKL